MPRCVGELSEIHAAGDCLLKAQLNRILSLHAASRVMLDNFSHPIEYRWLEACPCLIEVGANCFAISWMTTTETELKLPHRFRVTQVSTRFLGVSPAQNESFFWRPKATQENIVEGVQIVPPVSSGMRTRLISS